MSTHLNLVSELEHLASELEADASPRPEVSLASIAERIAKLVGVRPDEVAILGLSTSGAICIFWRRRRFAMSGTYRSRALPRLPRAPLAKAGLKSTTIL